MSVPRNTRPEATLGWPYADREFGSPNTHLNVRFGTSPAVSPAGSADWKRAFVASGPHPLHAGIVDGSTRTLAPHRLGIADASPDTTSVPNGAPATYCASRRRCLSSRGSALISIGPVVNASRTASALSWLRAAQFLQEEDLNVSQIANALKDQRALMMVGGGPNWFSAREGALKVEEESSLLCKVYRPAEYTHNAIPLLSDEVATVVIAPPGKAYARLDDAMRTARAARSPSLALVVEGDDGIAPGATFVIAVPGPLGEMLMPPLAAIAFQLLGYYLGAERGYNPDTLRTDDLDHARAWLTAFPFGSH